METEKSYDQHFLRFQAEIREDEEVDRMGGMGQVSMGHIRTQDFVYNPQLSVAQVQAQAQNYMYQHAAGVKYQAGLGGALSEGECEVGEELVGSLSQSSRDDQMLDTTLEEQECQQPEGELTVRREFERYHWQQQQQQRYLEGEEGEQEEEEEGEEEEEEGREEEEEEEEDADFGTVQRDLERYHQQQQQQARFRGMNAADIGKTLSSRLVASGNCLIYPAN